MPITKPRYMSRKTIALYASHRLIKFMGLIDAAINSVIYVGVTT